MIKKTGIIIALIFAFIFVANAQNDDTQKSNSEIVMTKSELSQLLERIALIKKRKMQENRKKADKEKLLQLRQSYYGNFPQQFQYPGYSQGELLNEINRLNAYINHLTYGHRVPGSNSSTIVAPPYGGAQGGVYPYPAPQQPQSEAIVVNPLADGLKSKLDSMQYQLNCLLAQDNAASESEKIAALNRQILEMQSQLTSTRNLSDEDKEVLRRYGNSKLQVFFANNAAEVSSEYRGEVQRAAAILKENPQLTIVLKGYASTLGSPRYNYELSMRRNESVKRLLVEYGVFPDQISSVFYGEDPSTSESVARRVDMSFIIK